jgi:pimeloyl-ACP methyl ester carboxylesterase
VIGSTERKRGSTSGGEMGYVETGEGAPLLLLHGLGDRASAWEAIAPMLASSFRVISPDPVAPGGSASNGPLDTQAQAQAGYLSELLDALAVESLAVAGHGEGGAIAQALALDDHRVRALVLIGSPALADRQGAFDASELPILLLWGEDDRVVPVHVAEGLSESMPSSVLAVLPGCAHVPMAEAPETVGSLMLDWLRSRYLGIPHGHGSDSGAPVVVTLGRRPPPEAEFQGETFEDEDDEHPGSGDGEERAR